ncbi:hypothetical protein TNCT_728581 [Trichonephila clavata]|uniref:Uncharacterized protein n=1 Tax=Trichonephila clavata TaxID=2740835 RepID=A0A8X6G884_TRICU|nr:hypothetical protein TNCT_728581 [Trichonephila clavata]
MVKSCPEGPAHVHLKEQSQISKNNPYPENPLPVLLQELQTTTDKSRLRGQVITSSATDDTSRKDKSRPGGQVHIPT